MPRPEARRQRLPRAARVHRGSEIREVLRRGKRSRTASLDVFASPSPVGFSRVGWIVPKHGNTGVRRNRLKRRLRELLRREILPELPAGENAVDVVVRTRREAYGAAFPQLREELSRWLERSTGRSAGR